MEPKTIHVNFDEIQEIAFKGVRRAVVFLGLALNAAYDKDFKDYQLSKITQIDIVPHDVNDEAIAAFKTEFSIWIMGCGLRELVETFTIFLDHLYEVCLVFNTVKTGVQTDQLSKSVHDFSRVGLGGKLERLKHEFEIEPKTPNYLTAINQARNCLTHRRGIVGKLDIGKEAKLSVKWRGFETFVRTPDGEEIPLIPRGITDEIYLKDGGRVMLRFPERSKTFKVGQQIILTPVDLSEICQLFLEETKVLSRRGMDYAQKLGISMANNSK